MNNKITLNLSITIDKDALQELLQIIRCEKTEIKQEEKPITPLDVEDRIYSTKAKNELGISFAELRHLVYQEYLKHEYSKLEINLLKKLISEMQLEDIKDPTIFKIRRNLNPDEFVNFDKARRILKVGYSTLNELAKERKLKIFELYRFKYFLKDEIDKLNIELGNKGRNRNGNGCKNFTLNSTEVRKMLRIGEGTLREMVKSGQLNPVRVGKRNIFKRKDIENLFKM